MTLYAVTMMAGRLMIEHKIPAWTLRFDRSKRRFGRCNHGRKEISLSRFLVQLNDESKVRDVILHEIAHALAGPGYGHRQEWKLICRRIGAEPIRCYGSDVLTPDPKWVGTCPKCPYKYYRFRLSRNMYNRSCGECSSTYSNQLILTWKRL